MDIERLTFRIDSFTPKTLPMARLGQYLTALAELYGSEERVHFEKLLPGSARLQVAVEQQAFPKVFARLQSVKGKASVDADTERKAQQAYVAIDRMLRQDNAVATISRVPGGAKVIDFPGRKLAAPETFTIVQPMTVDGVVIKIGGRDETIPVTLKDQEGRITLCQVRGVLLAKDLARYYLDRPLRVSGSAKMVRNGDGVWELEVLNIQSFEVLDEDSAGDVLQSIAEARGNEWRNVDDPLEAWRRMRGIA